MGRILIQNNAIELRFAQGGQHQEQAESESGSHFPCQVIPSPFSKKGFRGLKAPISGTKTSQSEMDGNVVVIDGKVRTPKPYPSILCSLITKTYKEYTEEYLKLLEQQQEEERKAREQNEVKVKSSFNSQVPTPSSRTIPK